MMIGKPFKGGVVGGLTAVDATGNPVAVTSSKLFDFGALPFDATSGAAMQGSGGIQPVDQLASWGKTVLTAVGATPAQVTSSITGGTVINAALA
jgi:hypothetical protein